MLTRAPNAMQCKLRVSMQNQIPPRFSVPDQRIPITTTPNAPITKLNPELVLNVAPFVCKLAVAVLVPVPPDPPAVSAESAGTTVVLVTVLCAPFARVVVEMICCVTNRLVDSAVDENFGVGAVASNVLDTCPEDEEVVEVEEEL